MYCFKFMIILFDSNEINVDGCHLITLFSQMISRLKIYLDCKSFCFYFPKPGITRPNLLINNNYVRTF